MQGITKSSSGDDRRMILLVEDEPVLRDILKEGLVEHGYDVQEASGGHEAILRMEEHTRIDLLLTDVRMPHMSGPELCKAVKSRHPETPVLFMSGFTDYSVLLQDVADGSVALIQKPFTLDMLCAQVDAILLT
ncbi:MAG TPA: response regulator [Bryobacteraceae bacterium]|nr:response regulator [Bryobacteraceae bacterium]